MMKDKTDMWEKVIAKLDLLNKRMAELISLERKINAKYDYINANELAEMLGESIKTIYSRVHYKQIPYYKPGGKLLLFKTDEIKEWINQGRHSSIEELNDRI